jgi:hypothetical protein
MDYPYPQTRRKLCFFHAVVLPGVSTLGFFMQIFFENILYYIKFCTTFAAMNKNEFFKLVPAKQFFTQYCPEVKRFYHKMNGIDGNKQPIDFSPEDKKKMKLAVKALIKDLSKTKFDN